MLETYNDNHLPHDLCYERSREFSYAVASLYAEELCCPQPWRPASPVLGRNGRKRRSPLTTSEEAEREASQEIQEILFSQLTGADEGTCDSRYQQSPFPIVFPLDDIVDKSDGHEETPLKKPRLGLSSYPMRRNPRLEKRPRLGNSQSRLFVPDPVPTPPVRSHNPLPMNSPFVNRKPAHDGAEFGLLSVSPPPCAEDDDLCARRNRVKLGLSSALVSETVNKPPHPMHTQQPDEDVFGCPFEVTLSF